MGRICENVFKVIEVFEAVDGSSQMLFERSGFRTIQDGIYSSGKVTERK